MTNLTLVLRRKFAQIVVVVAENKIIVSIFFSGKRINSLPAKMMIKNKVIFIRLWRGPRLFHQVFKHSK